MFSNLKLKLQDVRVRRQLELIELTENVLELTLNILENLSTNNILSDTPGDLFNTGKIGIHITKLTLY